MRHLPLALAAAVLCSTLALPAHAQTEAEKLARATALFEEGTKLLDARRHDEACPKLREAVELVPIGVGAQLALGACYEGQGRLASALVHYEKAAALGRTSGQVERAQRAEAAARSLAARVGTLTLRVEGGAPIPGLVVTVDGVPVPADALGAPRPVDAGEHAVRATASGHAPFEATTTTRDGSASELALRLVRAAAPPPGAGAPTSPPDAEDERGSPLRPIGIVVGGVGVAGLVVGAVTGALAIGGKSDGDEGCDERGFCPASSIEARDDAFTMATISTIGFAAGGALLATGVVLYVVGGDDGEAATAAASVGPRGIVLRGTF